MAYAKKGWRKITVDGTVYHWKLQHRSPWLHAAIAHLDVSGQVFRAYFDEDHVITPKIIEFLIQTAKSRGWQPEEARLPEFVLIGDELVKDTDYQLNHPLGADLTHF